MRHGSYYRRAHRLVIQAKTNNTFSVMDTIAQIRE